MFNAFHLLTFPSFDLICVACFICENTALPCSLKCQPPPRPNPGPRRGLGQGDG